MKMVKHSMLTCAFVNKCMLVLEITHTGYTNIYSISAMNENVFISKSTYLMKR